MTNFLPTLPSLPSLGDIFTKPNDTSGTGQIAKAIESHGIFGGVSSYVSDTFSGVSWGRVIAVILGLMLIGAGVFAFTGGKTIQVVTRAAAIA